MVRHVIEGANPGDDLDPAPFVGARDQLDCITTLPDAAGPTGNRHMQATLLVDASHRLVLRWRSLCARETLEARPTHTETELLRGVSRIELAFLAAQVEAGSAHGGRPIFRIWCASDCSFPEGDARHWPDIVAAPALDRP